MRETEIKLAIHGSFNLPSLPLDTGVTNTEELPTQDLRAVYYDTTDLRLARNGVTLRHRTGEETPRWTLKLPVPSMENTREEIELEAAPGRVPLPLAELVIAYTRARPLTAMATLRTLRRGWALSDAEGRTLALMVDDEVSVLEGRKIVARFRELEVESVDASRAELNAIAGSLRDAGAAPAEPIPKAVRALGARALAPPDVPPPIILEPSDPSGATLRNAFARATGRLVQNDSAMRLGQPEGVHQMRVAARRLRSLLRTFQPLLAGEKLDGLSDELRWAASLLGDVRNLDVLIERFEPEIADLAPLDALVEGLREKRRVAASQAIAQLAGGRYTELLDRLTELSSAPPLVDEADKPATEVLPALVAKTWSKLAKSADKITPGSTDGELHKVRIRAKRARYAMEAITEVVKNEKKATRYTKRLAALQEVLGAHNDASVAREIVAQAAADRPDDGGFNLAAGRLIERELNRSQESRDRFQGVWKKLARDKGAKWLAG